jgi:exodeoxyribonuclease-1
LCYSEGMNKSETFLWYDLETFGLDARSDRIAQFAAVRTNSELKVMGDPIVLYCRLSDDYLPDPLAVLVTGITPQYVNEHGVSEREFITRIHKLMSQANTCSVGYNTIAFDDEFIRHALFRNFFDPYKREYENGNSRWDILDLVRATHDFRPEGIHWPRKENGNPSFKLTDLTEANNIEHEGAHDALSDVYATLNLARLIKEKQPRLFDYYLTLRNKHAVKELLRVPMGEPVVLTGGRFTSPSGCSTVVMPLSSVTSNPNTVIVFDLLQDPSNLLDSSRTFKELEDVSQKEDNFKKVAQQARKALKDGASLEPVLEKAQQLLEEAATMVATLPRLVGGKSQLLREQGVHKIQINKVPFISPLSIITEALATKLDIDLEMVKKHRQMLYEDDLLAVNIRKAADSEQYPLVSDVDFSLYSAFFSDKDHQLFNIIRETSPTELWDRHFDFKDSRAHEMLWRYLCRSFPEEIIPEQQPRWRSFCTERIISPPGKSINTLQFFARKIEEKVSSKETSPQDKELLVTLEAYGKELCSRLGIQYPSHL